MRNRGDIFDKSRAAEIEEGCYELSIADFNFQVNR